MQKMKEEIVAQAELNQKTRIRKEQAAVDLQLGWLKFKQWMEEEVLPYVERAELIPREVCIKHHEMSSGITSGLYHLQAPHVSKPLTEEEKAEQAKIIEERNRRAEELSDIQQCVNEWLKEHLVYRIYDSFHIDTDYDDGECMDTEYELT